MKPVNAKKTGAGRDGSVLMISMFFVFLASAVAGTFVMYSAYDAEATRRVIDTAKARIAAESGLDYAMVKLKEQVMYHLLSLNRDSMQTLLSNIPPPPAAGGYVFENVHGVTTFVVRVETDKVTGSIPKGKNSGFNGDYQTYSLAVGAVGAGRVGGRVHPDLNQPLQWTAAHRRSVVGEVARGRGH